MGSSHALHPPTDVHSDGGSDCWEKRLKGCLAWLGVLSMSVVGGLMLGLWTSWYHPTNSQLWMVPFGLVLLVTPVLAWVSVVASDTCCHVVVAEDPQGQHHHKHPPDEPFV